MYPHCRDQLLNPASQLASLSWPDLIIKSENLSKLDWTEEEEEDAALDGQPA